LSAPVEFGDERLDPLRDVVAGRADLLDRAALRVREVPVDVTDAGHVGALVAAAHRHHDVGPFGVLGAEQLRPASGEVDPQLEALFRLRDPGLDEGLGSRIAAGAAAVGDVKALQVGAEAAG
jgi:hypothetical protein